MIRGRKSRARSDGGKLFSNIFYVFHFVFQCCKFQIVLLFLITGLSNVVFVRKQCWSRSKTASEAAYHYFSVLLWWRHWMCVSPSTPEFLWLTDTEWLRWFGLVFLCYLRGEHPLNPWVLIRPWVMSDNRACQSCWLACRELCMNTEKFQSFLPKILGSYSWVSFLTTPNINNS